MADTTVSGAVNVKPSEVWKPMAVLTAVRLRQIAAGSLRLGQVPEGAFVDAESFLESALNGAASKLFGLPSEFPDGDRANFITACQAFRLSSLKRRVVSLHNEEALDLLLLADFIRRIARPSISSNERTRVTAQWAASFFSALASLPE